MRKLKFSNGRFFSRRRVTMVKFFVLLFIPSIIMVRLFFVQVWSYDKFLPLVKKQVSSKIKLYIPRGDILDRNGKKLATTLKYETVSINSSEFLKGIQKDRKNLEILSSITNISEKEILLLCEKEKYVTIKQLLPISITSQLKYIRGLDFETVLKRFYPYEELACYVLGGVGADNRGYSGIEIEFENFLANVKSREIPFYKNGKVDKRSFRLSNLCKTEEMNSKNYSVVLTIDSKLQYSIEEKLKSAYEKYEPQKVMCVVQNPENGEILAMAVYPYTKTPLTNPIVNSVYEPGSIFKIFPVAIFLEEGIVNENTMVNCESGKFFYGGNLLSDLHPHKFLSMKDVIAHSSNIGMAKAYLLMNDPVKYCAYLKLFGFDAKTGIELPGEIKGVIVGPESKQWSLHQPIAMSIGQGIFVTLIQMVNAYSAIANGGELLQPTIVKNIIDKNNNVVYESEKVVVRKILSEKTVELLKGMLESVVEYGTAKGAKIENVSICAKTGTAQKYDKQIKRYSDVKSLISVCGFFPKDKPKYVIGLFFDEPKRGRLSSDVAVPVFREIVLELLNYDEERKLYAKAY